MDRNRIDHAVVLNLSQLYGNGLRLEEMKRALRFQNDFNAQLQHDHPDKFTCGFVVHSGYIRGALW
jgi:aminocarboxymuconate-semialdehyde decarboxylase